MTVPILLYGPTGSGKSASAMGLARELDGVIVNADAMQVYRDLRILSARPSQQDEAAATHALYGFIDAGERYSTGKWLDAALAEIKTAKAKKRTPILVGGTGLYFKALTEGLAEVPPIPAELRAGLGAALKTQGLEALHARLAPEDAARIRPSDTARILRALEVLEVTGGSLTELQETKTAPPLMEWRGIAFAPDRASLYQATDARFDAMMEAGALEEARSLAARRLDPDLPAMKALGAPALVAHLKGEISLPVAVERAKRDTRRYAKRQFTWIAGQLSAWAKVKEEDPARRLEAVICCATGR